MPLTQFPGGVSSFGMPVMGGSFPIPPTTGVYFFVNNSDSRASDGNPGTDPTRPFSTIAQALLNTVASRGDVIVVGPGHAESISGAGAITCSTAGVTIIGLGWGRLRPLITLHTTVTTIAISAANVTWANIRITTDVDAVVKAFNITAAGVTLFAVDFVETASCALLCFVLTTAAAVDLIIQDCSWVNSQTAASALQQWIILTGADRAKIINNYASLKGFATANPANGVVVGVTTAANDVEIRNNRFITLNSTGAVPISLLANTTGMVTNNFVASAKTAIAGSVALANAYGGNNYAAHTVNKSGLLDPVVDT